MLEFSLGFLRFKGVSPPIGMRIARGFTFVVLLACVIAGVAWFGLDHLADSIEVGDDTNRLVKTMHEVRLAEKNFIIRGERNYIDEALSGIDSVRLQAMATRTKIGDEGDKQIIDNALMALSEFERAFIRYVRLVESENEIVDQAVNWAREAEHKADAFAFGTEEEGEEHGPRPVEERLAKLERASELIRFVAEARIEEKNFLLGWRNEHAKANRQYVDQAKTRALELHGQFSGLATRPVIRAISRALVNYEASFAEAVKIREARVLAEERMVASGREVGEMMAELRTERKARVLAAKTMVLRILAAVAIGAIAIGIGLAWMTTRSIAEPLNALTSTLLKLSERKTVTVIPGIERGDELGEMARATDVFRQVTAEIERQRWMTSVLAELSTKIRMAPNEDDLCRVVLNTVCPLLSVVRGGVYLVDPKREVLVPSAFWASDRKVVGMPEFRFGEGLVGQCAADKQAIVLADAPERYAGVRSGFGTTAVTTVAVYPIALDDTVLGVAELALFHAVSADQSELLSEVRRVVAVNIDRLRRDIKTGQLQEETKRQAELLAAQEDLKRTLVELQTSNSRLERFAEVAAHDLQEPVRMIITYAQLLERRYGHNLDQEATEFIDFMLEGAQRMGDLIRGILDFGRIKNDIKPFEKVHVGKIVERASKQLALSIQDTGAIIHHADLPLVRGDREQLLSLFVNLMSNAMKFSRPGIPPTIDIDAEIIDGDWQLSVADNGIGIEAQYHDRIFQIFKRLHNSSEYAGTGIGLSICKEVVERHGGRIWVESGADAGSTFRFTLPAVHNGT